MRVSPEVQRFFKETYGQGDQRIWVYKHGIGDYLYLARRPGEDIPPQHPLNSRYKVAGPLNLGDGVIGAEDTPGEVATGWIQDAIRLLLVVAKLLFVVATVGFCIILAAARKGTRRD